MEVKVKLARERKIVVAVWVGATQALGKLARDRAPKRAATF